MDARTEMREEVTWRRDAAHEEKLDEETILLVEDEAFVREVTGEVLRSAGYRVLTAKNAVEAECEFERSCGEVDLLLTDVILPGESGRALAGRLRRENPGLRILLVTGYVEQMGASETGYEECLAKPFSAEILLRRVRQMIDCGGFQAREENGYEEEDGIRRACGRGWLAGSGRVPGEVEPRG